MFTGTLIVEVTNLWEAQPIEGAEIEVFLGGHWQDAQPIAHVHTDSSGRTQPLSLYAPDPDCSMHPDCGQLPYGEYDLTVRKEGYQTQVLLGTQVCAGVTSLQEVNLMPLVPGMPDEIILQQKEHFLRSGWEMAGEPNPKEERLGDQAVPQTLTVHLGAARDRTAPNVVVPFAQYIKRMTAGQVYPTWPDNALCAVIYCMLSRTLYTVFTQKYRSQGYDFDLCSGEGESTYYVPGRNTFVPINRMVDMVFDRCIQKENAYYPFFAPCCDGHTHTGTGLCGWKAVDLAKEGYSPLEILQHFFGEEIFLVQVPEPPGALRAYPETTLEIGNQGKEVMALQMQLRSLCKNRRDLPLAPADGHFDTQTQQAVLALQKAFCLPETGKVEKSFWYRLGERCERSGALARCLLGPCDAVWKENPGYSIALGATGKSVRSIQTWLKRIALFDDHIPDIGPVDGIFGLQTQSGVLAFQNRYGLIPSGGVDLDTWNRLQEVQKALLPYFPAAKEREESFPGILKIGTNGEKTRLVQNRLNLLGSLYREIPLLVCDGVYGPQTANGVRTFQRLFGIDATGMVDAQTWEQMLTAASTIQ